MSLFGRDSIITSLQALPYQPELARTTLRMLAARQGTTRRRLPRRGAGQDPARDPLRRADGDGRAAPLALLRHGRRDAAVPRPARRVRALDRRHGPRPRARAQRPRRARVDRRLRRPRRRRLRRVREPQPATRPGQPVLEGLLELDPVRRRHARARRRSRRARSRATSTTRSAARRAWRARSGATRRSPTGSTREADELRAPLPRGLLDPGPRVLRARARRRQAPGRQPHLEHRAPALERDRPPRGRRRRRPST